MNSKVVCLSSFLGKAVALEVEGPTEYQEVPVREEMMVQIAFSTAPEVVAMVRRAAMGLQVRTDRRVVQLGVVGHSLYGAVLKPKETT